MNVTTQHSINLLHSVLDEIQGIELITNPYDTIAIFKSVKADLLEYLTGCTLHQKEFKTLFTSVENANIDLVKGLHHIQAITEIALSYLIDNVA